MEIQKKHSSWVLVRLQYKDLNPATDYNFSVVSSRGELMDFRKLKTLPKQMRKLRWAVASCMTDGYTEQKQQWQQKRARSKIYSGERGETNAVGLSIDS